MILFITLFTNSSFAANSCVDLFAPAAFTGVGERTLEDVKEIKVMSFNVEQLFLAETGDHARPGKPLHEQQGLAKAINDESPDFIILEEVGGLEALTTFSRDFLNAAYEPYLVQGNDQGGIDIGYLVKRDLPLGVTLESHREAMWNDPTDHQQHRVFTRDAPALFVRAEGAAEDSAPLLILIGNHAKAMRDRDGDPESEILRAAQYREIGHIIDSYQQDYGAEVPILVGGDFNADVQSAASLAPIRQRMKDPFDLTSATDLERTTHTFHPRKGPAIYHQLDALFVTPSLVDNVIDIETYRYKNKQGHSKPLPTTFDERKQNPSDHFPIVLTLSTKKIFAKTAAGF